jgi:hypothetical protein
LVDSQGFVKVLQHQVVFPIFNLQRQSVLFPLLVTRFGWHPEIDICRCPRAS